MVWRWLHEDAIRPCQHRCWIFPRDPQFEAKVGRIRDLYVRTWQGRALREGEFVLSTDGKTSIQARRCIHPSLPIAPGKPMCVEHEYERCGAWAYLAALDVQRAKVFGRCEATIGIAPFARLVDQVMNQPPYHKTRRVFWVMNNGSSHRGKAAVERLRQAHPRLVAVHGPVHASGLNQVEIYLSILQRKVLTPNDFPCLEAVAERLCAFEHYYERIVHPPGCRYLVKDFGTSQSQNRLANATSFLAPAALRPSPLRTSSLGSPPRRLPQWLDGVSDALACRLRGFGTFRSLRHSGDTPAPYAYRGLPASCFAFPWRAAVEWKFTCSDLKALLAKMRKRCATNQPQKMATLHACSNI